MSDSISASLIGQSSDAASTAKARADANSASWQSTMDGIKEKGFLAWVQDLQQQKIEEMRQKLLDQMGLTEEDLAKLPADQRAAIEKTISEEIERRLEASSAVNKTDDEANASGTGASSTTTSQAVSGTSSDQASSTATTELMPAFARFDTSLLRVLEQNQENGTAQGQEDSARQDG